MEFIKIEYLGLFANLGTLTVAGILYIAYVKNLRSQINLKNEQLQIAQQNINLWKDKALQLERQSPQYIEKVLDNRIGILEKELKRFTNDENNHKSEINKSTTEIERLKKELETIKDIGREITYYDSEAKEFIELTPSDLELRNLGEIQVDSASLMICDPFYTAMTRDQEKEHFPVTDLAYLRKDNNTICYLWKDDEKVELYDLNEELTGQEMVEMELLERIDTPKEFPVDPDSYINGNNHKLSFIERDKVKLGTFYNGSQGASLSIGLHGDGTYLVQGEFYKGEIQRIIIDI